MERKLIHYFIRIKGGMIMWAKIKSTTPSLAFPFFLILNKTGTFSEKEDMCFGGSGIKQTSYIGFLGCFSIAP